MYNERWNLSEEERAKILAKTAKLEAESARLEEENREYVRQILSRVTHVYGLSPVSIVTLFAIVILNTVAGSLTNFALVRRDALGGDILSESMLFVAAVSSFVLLVIVLMAACYDFFSSSIVKKMIGSQCMGFATWGLFVSDLLAGDGMSLGWPKWVLVIWVLGGSYIVVRSRFTERNMRWYLKNRTNAEYSKQQLMQFFRDRR